MGGQWDGCEDLDQATNWACGDERGWPRLAERVPRLLLGGAHPGKVRGGSSSSLEALAHSFRRMSGAPSGDRQ